MNKIRSILFRYLCVAYLCLSAVHAACISETDVLKAIERAVGEKRPLLILFSDEEHCPPCKAFEEEVMSQELFGAYAKEHLVVLKIPCDLSTASSKSTQGGHFELHQFFAIERYPTWWFLDERLRPMIYGGYQTGGAKQMIATLKAAKRIESEKVAKESQIFFNTLHQKLRSDSGM